MDQSIFEKSIDQSRHDRLRGEILAAVSEFDQQGYTNLEIARALVLAAMDRAWRENQTSFTHFLQFLRDSTNKHLARRQEVHEKGYWEKKRTKLN